MILVAAGIFISLQTKILDAQHQLLGTIIIITLLEVAISIPLRMYMSILRTEVRYFDIGLFEIIRVSLRIGGITLALFLGAGLVDIVIIGSVANLIFFILPLLSTLKRHKVSFFNKATINKKMFYDLLNFSKSTAVSQTAEFLKFRTDSVLVAAVIGITAAAHYTIIVFIVMMLTQVLMRFLSYWDTIIIDSVGRNNHRQALEKLFKSLAIGIFISLLSLFNIIIFGKTFITLWVGEQYAFLHGSLVILTLILLGISFQMATTPYFNAIGKEKINAWIDFGEVILKLIIFTPMALVFHLNGFIYTSLVCAAIFSIGLRLYYLSAHSELSIADIINKIIQQSLLPLAAISALLTLYYLVLFSGIAEPLAQTGMLIVQILVAILIYKCMILKKLSPKPA